LRERARTPTDLRIAPRSLSLCWRHHTTHHDQDLALEVQGGRARRGWADGEDHGARQERERRPLERISAPSSFYLLHRPRLGHTHETATLIHTDSLSLSLLIHAPNPPSPCLDFHTPYAEEHSRNTPTVGEKEGYSVLEIQASQASGRKPDPPRTSPSTRMAVPKNPRKRRYPISAASRAVPSPAAVARALATAGATTVGPAPLSAAARFLARRRSSRSIHRSSSAGAGAEGLGWSACVRVY
jgi:hypothetical protein